MQIPMNPEHINVRGIFLDRCIYVRKGKTKRIRIKETKKKKLKEWDRITERLTFWPDSYREDVQDIRNNKRDHQAREFSLCEDRRKRDERTKAPKFVVFTSHGSYIFILYTQFLSFLSAFSFPFPLFLVDRSYSSRESFHTPHPGLHEFMKRTFA